jgi:hypothetical protein
MQDRDEQLDKSAEEIKHALDDFRCASDSVASRFQPPRGGRSDPLAPRNSLGGPGH